MFRYVVFIFLMVTMVSRLQAQSDSDSADGDHLKPPGLIIKHCPLSHIDFIAPSIQFAAEYRIFRRISIQNEFGYITKYASLFYYILDRQADPTMSGYRVRTEVRFYIGGGNYANRFYIAPEFLYRSLIDKDEKEYVRYDIFIQTMELKSVKTTYGGHFKVGIQFYPGDSWLAFDLYGGIGLRSSSTKTNDLPEDAVLADRSPFAIGDYTGPSISLGLKIGYRIK